MLNEKVAELLNTQVNKEFYSAYLYLDFANFYEDQGLKGFANWYRVQAQEERDHATLMIQYLQNNDCKVVLEAIDKPDQDLKDKMDPLKAGYAHEQYVTGLIHNIYDAAYSNKDYRTMQFLDWFVKEQGEEETNASDLIKKWRCSERTREVFTCWTVSLQEECTQRRLWYCDQGAVKGIYFGYLTLKNREDNIRNENRIYRMRKYGFCHDRRNFAKRDFSERGDHCFQSYGGRAQPQQRKSLALW